MYWFFLPWFYSPSSNFLLFFIIYWTSSFLFKHLQEGFHVFKFMSIADVLPVHYLKSSSHLFVFVNSRLFKHLHKSFQVREIYVHRRCSGCSLFGVIFLFDFIYQFLTIINVSLNIFNNILKFLKYMYTADVLPIHCLVSSYLILFTISWRSLTCR